MMVALFPLTPYLAVPREARLRVLAAMALLAIMLPVPVLAQRIFFDGFEPCSGDTDSDRLLDCEEIGLGTSRFEFDTDDDGLRDGDEVLGTLSGLDLPGMGADPLHKQVFVEIDWTDDSFGCVGHTHFPSAFVLQGVVAMFANAPIPNPDGVPGIELLIDAGQGAPFEGANFVSLVDGNVPGGTSSKEFGQLKKANFSADREGIFHYALFAHSYGGTLNNISGVADIVGDDLIVSVGCSVRPPIDPFGDVLARNTFAHELGHNLGLRHGGSDACNFRPNYNSVMNYRYARFGVDRHCAASAIPAESFDAAAVDFSRGLRAALDENALDETLGVCAHLGSGTVPIDWNKDGVIAGVPIVRDINADASASEQWATCGGDKTVLSDFDDWGHVLLSAVAEPGAGPSPHGEPLCPPVPAPGDP